MVSALGLILAHGADPTPLAWDEALANIVKFGVTFVLIAFMSYPILGPLLQPSSAEEVEPEEKTEVSEPTQQVGNREVVGWIAVALLVVLAMFWWLARASLVEVMTEEPAIKEDHAHAQNEGGQVAMWADFHAEVVRVESGEVRIFLRDSYNRDIAARFFQAEVQGIASSPDSSPSPQPRATATPKATPSLGTESDYVEMEAALNDSYRFARMPLEFDSYRVKVHTPGWSSTLKFIFDGSHGKRSLPIWCAR